MVSGCRHDGKNSVCLYLIFRFQYINDVFGYAYGDSILKRYGEILNRAGGDGELADARQRIILSFLLRYRTGKVAARQREGADEIIRFMHSSHNRQSVPTCAASAV